MEAGMDVIGSRALQQCLGREGQALFQVVGICNTPTYCGLGKDANDVFNKGHGPGMVKVYLRQVL